MTITIDLLPLKTAIRVIDANPDRWEQSVWGTARPDEQGEACGTAFCVAGHMVHQSPDFREVWWNKSPLEDTSRICLVGAYDSNNRWRSVGHAARMILGLPENDFDLSDDEHDDLCVLDDLICRVFDSDNNRADVQVACEELAEYIGQTWDVPLPEWALQS